MKTEDRSIRIEIRSGMRPTFRIIVNYTPLSPIYIDTHIYDSTYVMNHHNRSFVSLDSTQNLLYSCSCLLESQQYIITCSLSEE